MLPVYGAPAACTMQTGISRIPVHRAVMTLNQLVSLHPYSPPTIHRSSVASILIIMFVALPSDHPGPTILHSSPFVRLRLGFETLISLAQSFCRIIGRRTRTVHYIGPVHRRSRPFAQHTATALLIGSLTFVPSTFLDSRTYRLVIRLFRTIFSIRMSSFCVLTTSSRCAMASGG